MKLTPFGKIVRNLRQDHFLKLKDMADALGISSAYLSGMEYGEKPLADKFVEGTLAYFKDKVTDDEYRQLRIAAEQSKDVVNVRGLGADARSLVAVFARRLQEGKQMPPDLEQFLESRFDSKF